MFLLIRRAAFKKADNTSHHTHVQRQYKLNQRISNGIDRTPPTMLLKNHLHMPVHMYSTKNYRYHRSNTNTAGFRTRIVQPARDLPQKVK